MNRSRLSMRAILFASVLVFAVGCGNGPEGSSSSGAGGTSSSTSSQTGPGGAPATDGSFFDPCGGKIVDPKTGVIDPVEYEKQARAWDLATIDCRLGPKFTDAFPDQDDPRPTLYQPPKNAVPVHSPAHLDTYQIGSYEPNGDAYGVV